MYGLLIIWCVYAAASGFKDGVLWSRKGAESFSWNEHVIFVVERTAVVLSAIFATTLNIPELLVTMGAFVLIFSYVHNTSYYYSRSKIDQSKFDLKYSSTTSSARFDFDYNTRFDMAICGIVLLILGELFL